MEQLMIKLDYNMTRDYCSDWSAIDAIREVTQNAIDSGADFRCEVTAECITIHSDGCCLSPNCFALGHSVKQDGAIGKYGEGFKIAMLVLTRLGFEPVIHTGNFEVRGSFEYSEFTGLETFCLTIEQSSFVGGVLFICNSSDIDLGELAEKNKHFAGKYEPHNDIRILDNEPGMLYVHGLFVCKDSKLKYGYDFAPNRIQLNRDRNMATSVEWELAQYYADSTDYKRVYDMVKADCNDVVYLKYYIAGKPIAKVLGDMYEKQHSSKTIGRVGGLYYGGGMSIYSSNAVDVFTKCGISEAEAVPDKNSPEFKLLEFGDKHRSKLRRDVRKDFECIVIQSKGWRVK